MIVANNVALGDGYTDAQTYLSLSAQSVTLFVFNNPVAVKVLKRNPGGGHDYQETPEQILAPGTITFQNCVGVKLKNANPGQIARVFVTIPEYDPKSPDPVGIGFVPTTTLISSTGTLTSQSLQFLSVLPITADLALTQAQQDLTNGSIVFTTIGSNGKVLWMAEFDIGITVTGVGAAYGLIVLDGVNQAPRAYFEDHGVARHPATAVGVSPIGAGIHTIKLAGLKVNAGGTASIFEGFNTGLSIIVQDA